MLFFRRIRDYGKLKSTLTSAQERVEAKTANSVPSPVPCHGTEAERKPSSTVGKEVGKRETLGTAHFRLKTGHVEFVTSHEFPFPADARLVPSNPVSLIPLKEFHTLLWRKWECCKVVDEMIFTRKMGSACDVSMNPGWELLKCYNQASS